MKPRCVLYLSSFSVSSLVAQSLLVSIALVYFSNTHNFFSLSKACPSCLREMKVFKFSVSNWMLMLCGILQCPF